MSRIQYVPGVITQTDWGRRTACHACGASSLVNQNGEIHPHSMPRTEQMCRVAWASADLASAIARDSKLTDAERAMRTAVQRWHNRCRGTDSTGEPCGHRNCK
ncbi:hypothetical protein [Streptomyces sp. NPDC127072]|uniref:hypothetical protein n=1 Tax=Streptomyces sp. NPDC127072 TaxID=3347129 RepID=UPI00364F5970